MTYNDSCKKHTEFLNHFCLTLWRAVGMTNLQRVWRTTCLTSSGISWTAGSRWTTCPETCFVCSQPRVATKRHVSWLCRGWRCGSRTRRWVTSILNEPPVMLNFPVSDWSYFLSATCSKIPHSVSKLRSDSGSPAIIDHLSQYLL